MKKTKTSGGKPANKKRKTTNSQTAHKTSKKTTGKCSSAQKNSVKKAVSTKSKTQTAPTAPNKVQQADELRKKAVKAGNAMERIVVEWQEKLKGASPAEHREIDKIYQAKFDKADLKENQTYAEYYNFVDKNFTQEQQKKAHEQAKATQGPGNFMSKDYINGLANATCAKKSAKSHVGEIHRGNTKYIDKEPKLQRNYAVVKDKNGKVIVAKIKTIKKFDGQGKNADPALVEINHKNYGLPNRSGVDSETFDKNRIKNSPLRLSDTDVFPEGKPRASLSSHDKHKVLEHTNQILRSKKKKK